MAEQNSTEPNGDNNRGSRREPPGARGPQNMMSRGAMSWILLGGLAVILMILVNQSRNQAKDITWQEFLNYAKQDVFDGPVIIEDERIVGELRADEPGQPTSAAGRRVATTIGPDGKDFYREQLSTVGQDWKEQPGGSAIVQLLLYFSPWILFLLLIYFIFFRSVRGGAGGMGMLGNFGRSRHRLVTKEHSNVTLADVAGIDEAKDEVKEIIEFLKNPKRFQRLGGRVPRGVLLIGDPGCGKTLLAKAVAGEAEVPFFSISGSDFVEMFVGVGASRVRDLFKQAKDSSPCIIFLDEIDAVGRRRGSGFTTGGHDEREQTLNAILVEMDGFETNDQVIVIAATNRADVLDPALTRPGRFDRQIHVPLPDIRGRLEILKVHSKRIKLAPDVQLEQLARGTPMFSGADLAALINESAIGATLQNKDFVEIEDLEEARDKVRWGRAAKSRRIEEQERVSTAFHEAGHAVLQYLLEDADPLHKVTIIPRGPALGATFSLPEKDRYGFGLKYLQASIRVLCGGRIAEQRKTGDVTSGAAMDIKMITQYARHMILDWGMSDRLGFVSYSDRDDRETLLVDRVYSEETARVIDEEVRRLVDTAFADAQRMLEENWDKVDAIAQALLRFETLSAAEVDLIMKGQPLNKPTVHDLIKAEQSRPRSTPKPTAPQQLEEPPDALPSPA